MTSATPNIFDTFVNEVMRNLDEVLTDLSSDFSGSGEEGEPEADQVAEAPDTDLTPASLAREAVRVLKRAETAASVDHGHRLVAVADRYIRLSEIALID